MEAEETLPATDLADARASSRGDAAPRQIGRYTILERIGSGSAGAVFAAYDPNLDRRIALKILNRRTSNANRLREMLREAQALARLSHPNVVGVHDADIFDDRVFLAMDFIEGGTLRRWLRDLEPTENRWRRVLPVLCSAGRGLAAAHAAGLVHRDVKPQNVLVDEDGVAKVVDFGLALDRITSVSTETKPSSGPKPRAAGTPAYMAPEIYRGEPASPESDQFSFCVTAFEALVGHRPFAGSSPMTLMTAITSGRLEVADAGHPIPLWLRTIVMQGLEAAPDHRWESMDALLDALESDPAARRRRVIWMGGVGSSLVALGVLAGLVGANQEEPCAAAWTQLDGVWDDDRHAQLRDRFQRSGLPFADASGETVVSSLDAYAEQWVAAGVDVCEDQRAGGQTEDVRARRLACLQAHREGLAEATSILLAGGNSELTRSVSIVDSLKPVDDCAHAATLLAGRSPPPASAREEIRQIEDALARAEVKFNAAHYQETRTLLDELVARAEATEYGPTLGEALLLRATVLAVVNKTEEDDLLLERDYRRAWESGLIGDDDVVATRAAVALADYFGVDKQRFREGEDWVRSASALIERLDHRGLEVAGVLRDSLELVRGGILTRKHELEASIELHDQLYKSFQHKYGETHELTRFARGGLATALQANQQFDPAIELFSQNLQIMETRHGGKHPAVGLAANNVGLMLRHAERLEEGRAMLERSLEIAESHFGKDHEMYLMPAGNLAETCYEQRDFDCALEAYRDAFPPGQRSRPVGVGFLNRLSKFTTILYQRRLYEEARDVQEWYRWSAETQNSERFLFSALYSRGRLELRAGQADLAVDFLSRAAKVKELSDGAGANLEIISASALLQRGQPGDEELAQQRLKRARDKLVESGKRPDDLSALDEWLERPDPQRLPADAVLGADW